MTKLPWIKYVYVWSCGKLTGSCNDEACGNFPMCLKQRFSACLVTPQSIWKCALGPWCCTVWFLFKMCSIVCQCWGVHHPAKCCIAHRLSSFFACSSISNFVASPARHCRNVSFSQVSNFVEIVFQGSFELPWKNITKDPLHWHNHLDILWTRPLTSGSPLDLDQGSNGNDQNPPKPARWWWSLVQWLKQTKVQTWRFEQVSPVNGPGWWSRHFCQPFPGGGWEVTFQSVDRRTHEC